MIRLSCTAAFSAFFALTLGSMIGAGAVLAEEDKAKPKYTMKEIMTKGHKGRRSLVRRITEGGEYTDADVKQLLAYYEALALHKPERGDMESWKTKTAALVAAAKKLAGGDKSAIPELKKAANCKACHEPHKPLIGK